MYEKNWFIHCDVCQTSKLWATIYTVPFAFDRLVLLPKSSTKSILTKLRHREITSNARFFLKSFRLLLDHAPHLHSLSAEKSILRILTQNWRNGFICDHLSQKMSRLHSLHANINEKPYTSIDTIWLEKQQTKYNRSNCIITNVMVMIIIYG